MFASADALLRCNQLEDHVDYLSLQALLFKQASLGFVGQLNVFYTHTRRISD